MKVSSFAKVGVVLGAAAIAACTLTAPAQADISSGYSTLVGFGSDTTQDVMNAIAADINTAAGTNKLQSIDATKAGAVLGTPETVRVRSGQSVANGTPRAAGSGEGYNLLKFALGLTSSGTAKDVAGNNQTLTVANTVGKIDFSRASSKRGSNQNANGVIVNIPFAKDAVTVAFNPTSHLADVSSFAKGASGDSAYSLAADPVSLYKVYHCSTQYLYYINGVFKGAGTVANPALDTSADATAWKTAVGSLEHLVSYKIGATIPKSGSGTRDFMASQLGATSASWEADNSCVYSTWDATGKVLSKANGSTNIEEHDGTVADAVTDALAFYSIPMWVGQSRPSISGATDRRHGVMLGDIKDGSTVYEPTTGSGDAYATTANFPINRTVYNVVSSKLADDPNSNINEMFVGPNSLVCSASNAITRMGFIELSHNASAGADQCGSTDSSLRYENAPTVADAATAPILCRQDEGDDLNLVASVTVGSSNSNQGGTVVVKQGKTVVGTGTVPAGKTVGTVPVALIDNATALSFTFSPRLATIASKTLAPVTNLTNIVDCTSVDVASTSNGVIGTQKSLSVFVSSITAPAGTLSLQDVSVDNTGSTVYTNITQLKLVAPATVPTATDGVSVLTGAKLATLYYTPSKHIQRIRAVFTPAVAGVGSASASPVKTVTSAFLATTMSVAKTSGFTTVTGYYGQVSRSASATQVLTFSFTTPAGKVAPTGTVKVYAAPATSSTTTSYTSTNVETAPVLVGTATLSGGTATLTLAPAAGDVPATNVSSWIASVKGSTGTSYATLSFKFSGDDRYDIKTLLNQKIKIVA
jgi:hypothetical protein